MTGCVSFWFGMGWTPGALGQDGADLRVSQALDTEVPEILIRAPRGMSSATNQDGSL